MGIKLFLSSEDILNHVFAAVAKGYDPLDVDEYLDKILKDYRTVENNLLVKHEEVASLEKEIQKLTDQVRKLEVENATLSDKLSNIKPHDKVSSDNINLIKRINQLEVFLYHEGYDPKQIK